MKLNKLFILVFICTFICNPFMLFAQINERFDGESLSEMWQGNGNRFIITNNRLQLNAPNDAADKSYLSTSSAAIINAEWKFSLQMNFNPTSSNYLKFYLCSDNPVLTDELNGYYLQIGGNTDKQILLYRQTGKTTKKLNNSEPKRLDMNPVKIEVKVTKDDKGNWTVWSKKPDEDDFIEEFTCQDATVESSFYAGVVCIYTKTNSTNFFFDSISISGEGHVDVVPPVLQSHTVWADSLLLRFSEPVDADQAVFHFSESLSYQTEWRSKQANVLFRFDTPLKSGKKYTLFLESIPDLSGNILSDSIIPFALVEPVLPKDIIVNEVLFNPPTGGTDYVEIYNRSNKVLDLSQLNISNRRNGDLYATKSFGKTEILIFPEEYKVLAADKEKVCNFYDCRDEEAFLIMAIPAYANDSGYVVLTDKSGVIIDEFNYTASMHSPLIKVSARKGVALERQSFESDEWNSASDDSGLGTPGYQNSKRLDSSGTEAYISLENEACLLYQDKNGNLTILYHLKKGGYIANISVFSVNGRVIRKLGENIPLSTQGAIHWDGKDESGRIVPISPYILLFEAFHPNGDIYRKSLVGVISK